MLFRVISGWELTPESQCRRNWNKCRSVQRYSRNRGGRSGRKYCTFHDFTDGWAEACSRHHADSFQADSCSSVPDLILSAAGPPWAALSDRTAGLEVFQQGCSLLGGPLRLSGFPLRRRDTWASCRDRRPDRNQAWRRFNKHKLSYTCRSLGSSLNRKTPPSSELQNRSLWESFQDRKCSTSTFTSCFLFYRNAVGVQLLSLHCSAGVWSEFSLQRWRHEQIYAHILLCVRASRSNSVKGHYNIF